MENEKDRDSTIILICQIIAFSVCYFLDWWFSPKEPKRE
jgi:hypothetical protein